MTFSWRLEKITSVEKWSFVQGGLGHALTYPYSPLTFFFMDLEKTARFKNLFYQQRSPFLLYHPQ